MQLNTGHIGITGKIASVREGNASASRHRPVEVSAALASASASASPTSDGVTDSQLP